MGCNGSKSAGSPIAQANLAKCKETFEMQRQMAMGAVNEAKIADFITQFAGFFAPSVEFAANPKAPTPGLNLTGNFEEVMKTVGGVWLGFKVTKIENKSFTIKADTDNVIVVSQVYDNHLTDASGAEIPGTANKAMEVTQTCTYDADGKISAWVQDYDAKKVQASRNMAACRDAFDLMNKLVMGSEVDESMLAEFAAKLTEHCAPKFDISVNPKSSGPKLTGVTFAEAMAATSPTWLGFKNTSVENQGFVAKRDGTIEVAQVLQVHLTDASGAEVAGTALTSQLVHTLTYTDGKISSWLQEFDMSKLLAARETHILSLCKQTCEAQAQLAMGDVVSPEMLAEFGKKFASSFTPTFEMVVNPQVPGPHVTGTFGEVMEVIGPMWINFKNTKIESLSFSAKGDNVVVSQVWHQQLMDKSGQEVPGAFHTLEVQTTNTYTNGKVSKAVQVFDAAKVEATRNVARRAAEMTEGSHQVESLVEKEIPLPVVCADFLKASACM